MRAITDKSSDEGVQTSVAPAPTAIVAPHGRTGDTSRKGEGARQQDSGIHVQEGRSGDGEWDGDHDENEDGDGEEMMFGLPRKRVFEPLSILLSSQLILFVGVGALLPALPLYAQSIGLNGSANGIVLSAPALAMLFLNPAALKYTQNPEFVSLNPTPYALSYTLHPWSKTPTPESIYPILGTLNPKP